MQQQQQQQQHACAITIDNTTEEYPFFPITPNFPKWGKDLASQDGNYLFLDKSNTPMGIDPYKDSSTPVVFFAASVLKEIMYLAKKMAGTRKEVGGFILIKQIQDMYPQYLAYDHFMVGQEVTGVRVEMDNDDMVHYLTYLRETYPDELGTHIHSKLLHWHLHPQMGVTFSGTDIAQQTGRDKLGFRDDFRFYLCVNEKQEMNLQMVQYYPVAHRFDKVNIGMYYGENYVDNLTKKRKEVLDTWLEELVVGKVSTIPTYTGYQGDPDDLNDLSDCCFSTATGGLELQAINGVAGKMGLKEALISYIVELAEKNGLGTELPQAPPSSWSIYENLISEYQSEFPSTPTDTLAKAITTMHNFIYNYHGVDASDNDTESGLYYALNNIIDIANSVEDYYTGDISSIDIMVDELHRELLPFIPQAYSTYIRKGISFVSELDKLVNYNEVLSILTECV